MRKLIWKILITCPICFGFYMPAEAQNAPVTKAATVGNLIAGQQVSVPVVVSGFNNVGSISLTMDFKNSAITFVSSVINPLLDFNGTASVGVTDLGNGTSRLRFGWYGTGTYLPDGDWIIKYNFTYISGTSLLHWYDDGSSCAYTNDAAIFLNDTPASTYYMDGNVCGIIANPGSITGKSVVCQGTSGTIYSVNPFNNITNYTWSLPLGAKIVKGLNTNSITVDYAPDASSGNIMVWGDNGCASGPVVTLPVTINPSPVANAGTDIISTAGTSVILHALSGGPAVYTYHWSPVSLFPNPNIQNPATISLTSSTIFNVVVTNVSTLCQATDQVAVTIDITVGIEPNPGSINNDNTGNGFRIFPNPANDYFFIKSTEPLMKDQKLEIYSFSGVLLRNFEFHDIGIDGTCKFEVNDLLPGVYFVRIRTGLKNTLSKLIIK